MSLRAKTWAVKARRDLMNLLGAQCAWCGTEDDLTFDCIEPTGDDHHRKSTDQRMTFYRHQHFDRGNVQVLCARCNAKKGDDVIKFPRFELNWSHLGEFAPALPF